MADDLTIGVIGAGVMGSGIAQTVAQAGFSAVCCDVSDEVIEKARENVVSGRYGLDRAVQRGKLDREAADAAFARMRFTTSLELAATTDLVQSSRVADVLSANSSPKWLLS